MYFDFHGETNYSKELLNTFLEESQGKYLSGEMNQSAWKDIRKSVVWIEEYRETAAVSHRRLTKASFEYASPDFERLIVEYDAYIRSGGYLKENTATFIPPQCGIFSDGWDRWVRTNIANSHYSISRIASAKRLRKFLWAFLMR